MTTYTNLFSNPQPTITTGWGNTAGTGGTGTATILTTAGGPAGNQARRLTWTAATTSLIAGQWCGGGTGTAQNVPATPGSVYSVAGYVRSSKAQSMAARIQWLDAANTQLSVTTGTEVAIPANTWTEIKLENVTAPASAVSVRPNFYTGSSGTLWAVGDTLDVQSGTVVAGADVPQPFHGSMTNDATHTYAWVGTADASASTLDIAAAGLEIPTGLTAIPVSSDQIDLSWTAVSGALGYDIEADGAIIVYGHPLTTYSHTGLGASTSHTYRVRTVA